MSTPATGKGAHPRHRLDEVIHAPVRLSVMSALVEADQVAFSLLRDTVEVSDSLLSRHISTLESAGYVSVVKGYEGKRPRTWFSLTDRGREAFEDYRRTLRELIESGPIEESVKEPVEEKSVDGVRCADVSAERSEPVNP